MSKGKDLEFKKIDLQSRLNVANGIIKHEAQVIADFEKIKSEIDETQTYSPDNLQIAIENAAKEAELDFSISSVSISPVGDFNVNKIVLTTTPQQLHVIAKFESLLAKLEPYVAIVESSLTSDKKGNASMRYIISSFN